MVNNLITQQHKRILNMAQSRNAGPHPRRILTPLVQVLVILSLAVASGCASRKTKTVPVETEPAVQSSQVQVDPAARARLKQWCNLIKNGQHYSEWAKLETVNQLINQAEFIFDAPQWGKADYWATPYELLIENKGDCEDFTIAKYFTLREMGMPDNKLRLTYVKAVKLNQAHMVLSYYSEPGAVPLVLDNLNADIQPATRRTDLIPIFSFNGTGLWTAKARGDGKLVGNADRLAVWNDLRNRMDDYTSQYLAAHAGEQKPGSGLWFCR